MNTGTRIATRLLLLSLLPAELLHHLVPEVDVGAAALGDADRVALGVLACSAAHVRGGGADAT